MKHLKLENGTSYDGSQIQPMWAFKQFGIKDSSIVSWIGPMEIRSDELIDYEDVGIEIKGGEMINFIIEHFDVQPADMRLCYHRQRLFVTIVKDILDNHGIKTRRDGDDLYVEKGDKDGKLSVSIATCSVSSMKIHFALNLTERGTPDDVETAGLLECGSVLKRENIPDVADEVCSNYIKEISSIESDITKTRVF
ncbi:DUF366 family protein [Methanobacterium paludis]|uniref:DUF366 domain-containing protein n=1 Tax=Methanobacterium paludis (strain DSM 25820 / JCM 18151 / SWAN1) TaxID=868131 RepID=F6D3H0_METPW|nr:DUF366 family protein [Methanobacterium paludis]AEG19146.1 protein of unknown function DUF366 [Methanobacterium paludis]